MGEVAGALSEHVALLAVGGLLAHPMLLLFDGGADFPVDQDRVRRDVDLAWA